MPVSWSASDETARPALRDQLLFLGCIDLQDAVAGRKARNTGHKAIRARAHSTWQIPSAGNELTAFFTPAYRTWQSARFTTQCTTLRVSPPTHDFLMVVGN